MPAIKLEKETIIAACLDYFLKWKKVALFSTEHHHKSASSITLSCCSGRFNEHENKLSFIFTIKIILIKYIARRQEVSSDKK